MSMTARALRRAADSLRKAGIFTLIAEGNWLIEWEEQPLIAAQAIPHFIRETRHPITDVPKARLRFQSNLEHDAAQSAGTLAAAILGLYAQQITAQIGMADELLAQYRENALLLKAAAQMTTSPNPEDIGKGLLACAPACDKAVIISKHGVLIQHNITMLAEHTNALWPLIKDKENALYETAPTPFADWGGMLVQSLPPSDDVVVLWRHTPSFTSVDVNSLALLAHMAGPFFSHAEQRREKEKLHSTLTRYLPLEVAEKLLKENRVNLGGEAFEAAVLFADIRQFTQMTRTLGASAIVDRLNQLYTELVGIIQAHHGIVDKFMGDGVMATFGVPLPIANAEQAAVNAAQAILRAAGALGLELGIGISAGMVIAGNIGSPQRMDYTVIGDAVNMAAKLQKLVPNNTSPLLITDACFDKLTHRVGFQEVASLSILENTTPIKIYAQTS